MCFPAGTGRDAFVAEQSRRNDTIGLASKASIERPERKTKAMTPLLCQQQPASDGCRIAPRPAYNTIVMRISTVREFDEHVSVAVLRCTPDSASERYNKCCRSIS
jgi:hypothetical protein